MQTELPAREDRWIVVAGTTCIFDVLDINSRWVADMLHETNKEN